MRIPGKIPLKIHPLFWLIAFLIGWMWTFQLVSALLCVVVIAVSVLLHEYGHACTALAFGQKVRIELAAFGGFTYREGRKLRLWEEFLVVLDGPLVGALLAAGAFGLLHVGGITNPTLAFIVQFAFKANVFWTVINLIPVLPLDGGHLLSILLEAVFGFRGIKMAIIAGLVIAICISVFFILIGAFLIAALFLLLTFESFRSLRYYKIFSEKDRDADLQALMSAATADFQANNAPLALEKLAQVRQKAQAGILYTLATQEMATILRSQNRFPEAYTVLKPLQENLSGEYLGLLQFLAYQNQDYPTIVGVGAKCYQDNPTKDVALINALAHGATGDVEAALGWLECALREGLSPTEALFARPEFDAIRKDARFEQLHGKCS